MKVSRFGLVADIAGAEDWQYDPWGTASGLHFDICEVLCAVDATDPNTVAAFHRWQYRRGLGSVPSLDALADRFESDYSEGEYCDDYSYGSVALASAVRSGDISQSDLIHAGDVLARYAGLCRLAGLDY